MKSTIMPKPWFSQTQYAMWLSNKSQYRKKYYEDEKIPESKEIIFGKKIARMLELGKKNKILDNIPRYKIMEHRIEQKIGGYPFIGFIDSFDPKTKSIIEFKTGREPWTQSRVNKHEQLVIYSLLCKMAHKKVHPDVTLVWLETKNNESVMKIGDHALTGDGGKIKLTGNVKVFKRTVTETDRKEMKRKIIRALWEIMNDYREYAKNT